MVRLTIPGLVGRPAPTTIPDRPQSAASPPRLLSIAASRGATSMNASLRLGDLLAERRSAPVGDPFLAAARRDRNPGAGSGQSLDIGLRIPDAVTDRQ